MAENNYRKLFHFKNYLRLIVSSGVSGIGSQLTLLALPLYVYSMTGDAAKVGMVFACETVPWIVWGPFAGVWADRWDRRRLLIFCQLLSAIFMICLAYASSFSLVCAIAIILGVINAAMASAYGALLPSTATAQTLAQGYSLHNMQATAIRVLVPALGGLALQWVPIRALFFMDATSFVISAVLLLGLRLHPSPHQDHVHYQPWGHLREATSELTRTPLLRSSLYFEWVKTFAEALTFPLLVVLVTTTYRFSAAHYGYFTAIAAGGNLLGAFAAGKWLPRYRATHWMLIGSLLLFGSYSGLALPFPFLLLSFITLVGHTGDGVRTVLIHTAFGAETGDATRGCVIGLINASLSLVYVVGYALSGVVGSWVGIQRLFFVTGIMSILAIVVCYLFQQCRCCLVIGMANATKNP